MAIIDPPNQRSSIPDSAKTTRSSRSARRRAIPQGLGVVGLRARAAGGPGPSTCCEAREVSPLRRARSTRLRRRKTGRIDARPRPPLTAPGLRGSVHRPETSASHFQQGGQAWLVEDFRQDSFSRGANGARCGSRAGARTCCCRMAPSDGCVAESCSGPVADLPTRRDAQVRLDERLRPVNQGASRPESIIGFGAFVESNGRCWRCRPSSAQRSMAIKTVLRRACAADVAGLAAPRHRTARDPAMGRG